jgi:nitric-oxide synthase
VAITDLLEKAGLLERINIAHLESQVERADFGAGDVIIREGEIGDAAYIIESGAVQVYITTLDGADIVTARLQAGANFGEQALLQENHRRNSSVRAAEDTTLLRIPAAAMMEILVGDAALREQLAMLGREQDRQRFARQSALFKSMPLESFQRLQFQETHFGPGEIVFTEGDVADKVYLILSGRAAAYKDNDGSPTLTAVIDTGQCFGEMAIASHTRRAATIIAEGELHTLWIDATSFATMLGETPQLQQYMTTLNRMYQLPRRGFITQGTGTLMGEDAATCIYHLVDGSTVIAARTVDDRVFSMRRNTKDGEVGETFEYAPPTGLSVELTLADDGTLRSLTTTGEWEDVANACEIILQGGKLDRWRASVFSLTGRLQIEAAPKFGGDDEMFCTCVQVRFGTIREAIASGAPNAEAVIQKTNCSTVCGSCRPRLAELMGQNAWMPVRIENVIDLTRDIHGFRLAPWNGEFDKPALPGQHVVVEALIDDNWIRRSYTLTSHPEERRFREITVKREQHGIFSSWLFQANEKSLMRISDPNGEVVAGEGEDPIVCLVGGIGVTPGLVMCRTFGCEGGNRRVHVDYSVRDLREAICLDEFRDYAAKHPNITFNCRVTSKDGRIGLPDLQALLRDLPDATFFICGPSSYENAVSKLVAVAGVSPDRIKVETFTQAGSPVAAPAASAAAKERPSLPPVTPVDFPYKPIRADEHADVFDESRSFLTQVFYENGVLDALPARLREVEKEIAATGSYTQTYDELAYGCKIAWRNSTQCIGRLFWPAMKVIDARHLRDEHEIFEALVSHLRYATNGGRVRCLTTFFAPTGVHLWNHQIVRFAGYRQSDGSIIGDPSQVLITEQALALGWPGGKRTQFDVLPLIIQVEDRPPQWFEIPEDAVMLVPIVHPRYRFFEEMDLKWHAVPAATDLGFDMGGIKYHLMPFNGWYMSAEIGARNFCDPFRYDMVPKIAEKMGLDMSSEATLWRDRAMVEMNFAVLHSYARMGVTLVDHHTVTRKFMEYVAKERGCGRDVFTNWAWTVPPISGSQTPVFHVDFNNTQLKPFLFRMTRPWEELQTVGIRTAAHV